MKKTALYTYLGTNGTITSPVHLEDIYYILKHRLEADENKMPSNGNTLTKTVIVPYDEVENWREVYNKVDSK